MTRDERITWLSDVNPADWIAPRLHPFNVDTGSVIPEGFEAYCRIFHPVQLRWPDTRPKRWAEIAAGNGRIAHPEMQFHMINRRTVDTPPTSLTYDRGEGPEWGSLPFHERRELVNALRPETTTPEQCWFCIWDGFGHADRSGGRIHLPNRGYMLYTGPIEFALTSLGLPGPDTSPNLWWPDDRAWIVVTEIDYAWTYVGGTVRLVEQLLESDTLEVLPARLSDKPFYDSDVVNAALDEHHRVDPPG
jgi:hypothetical protein